MPRKILIQVTAPAVLIGLLLLATCLVSAWNVSGLQNNLSEILKQNVTSLEAAHQLEIGVRQLRFHCVLFLLDGNDGLRTKIAEDEKVIQHWLDEIRVNANTPREFEFVDKIEKGYARYRHEFDFLIEEMSHPKPGRDLLMLAMENPVDHVVVPCRGYLEENETQMKETAEESDQLSNNLLNTLLLLGIGGPIAGLVGGFGIAWGLGRSIYRLKVHVQDMAHHLDHNVASVSVIPDGDLNQLDHHLQYIVKRVEAVMARIQKQQRELLRAEQLSAVGQLAACVAHEVRNPLTSVKMLVGLALRRHNPKALQDQDLHVIYDEIGRVETTVQNLLDFARTPQPQRGQCDLREIVQHSLQLVHGRALQQQVDLQVDSPDSPVLALVDRSQIGTVLVNLLLNALDAMPRGGRLTLSLVAQEAEVQVRVQDTGAGIPPAMLESLFTPFASSKDTGTGLGLSISRGIIEDHGGCIRACNDAGGGACFLISLPRLHREVSHVKLVNH